MIIKSFVETIWMEGGGYKNLFLPLNVCSRVLVYRIGEEKKNHFCTRVEDETHLIIKSLYDHTIVQDFMTD